MHLQLAEHVALVVGGTGFLGEAIVRRLRAEGATVISAARGSTADLILDMSSDESVREGLARVVEEHGQVEALVVAAATPTSALDPSRLLNPDYMLQAFDAKTISFMRVVTAVLPIMLEQGHGRIVGISGQNALMTTNLVGSVRNAGLVVLAKNIADMHAGTGVTVNVVNPAVVTETPVAEVQRANGGESTPEDVAALVTFLVSPISGAVNGEAIAVGHRLKGATAL